jgi:1L-myo-inositol 1-phosphate cytidylyltransferase / CDP-L-myo-inositol myo-inositolphosphotransferase
VGNRAGSDVVVVFSGASAAARLVAGLPAAARVLREVAAAGAGHCTIAVPGGWSPGPFARRELDRLAQGMAFTVVDTAALAGCDEPRLLVQGERPVGADCLRRALGAEAVFARGLLRAPAREWTRLPQLTPAQAEERLDRASRAIIAATSKPGDGIVSQLLNRPLSQAITRVLLRLPGITPFHATAASAALAVAMLAALVFGGGTGLVVGAVLYQLASIVDGVDGEIARATFRASPAGAMADSLVDAVTNIGFLAGVVINLWIQGNAQAAIAGASGLAIMAVGLFLIGRRARRSEATFTFDGVKHHFKARRTWLSQMLIWLTMRDFIALGWLVGITLGMAAPGLLLFAAGAAIWLIVVLFVLRPRLT